MTSFTISEIKFLEQMEESRVATSHDNIPHVKPVWYLFENGTFYLTTDYDTRMYKNVLNNSHAALSIDVYKTEGHKAVCIQGKTT